MCTLELSLDKTYPGAEQVFNLFNLIYFDLEEHYVIITFTDLYRELMGPALTSSVLISTHTGLKLHPISGKVTHNQHK